LPVGPRSHNEGLAAVPVPTFRFEDRRSPYLSWTFIAFTFFTVCLRSVNPAGNPQRTNWQHRTVAGWSPLLAPPRDLPLPHKDFSLKPFTPLTYRAFQPVKVTPPGNKGPIPLGPSIHSLPIAHQLRPAHRPPLSSPRHHLSCFLRTDGIA